MLLKSTFSSYFLKELSPLLILVLEFTFKKEHPALLREREYLFKKSNHAILIMFKIIP